MDYFKILNLSREPFSNSPDPDFFSHSREHIGCLQKIELSLRLRRGLSVVIGNVGVGKTTLCRQLIREFANDGTVDTHLILDPYFSSPIEFLSAVATMFGEYKYTSSTSEWELREGIKKKLFRRGVDEKKTVVLIIDEGQKLPDFCLEILREFLNYETNEYKLLQIVIFAQKEFEAYLRTHQNFADRINLYHQLLPLNFQETRSMIQFRLKKAGRTSRGSSFFTYPAFWVIYRATGGYPRKIVNLCHRIILTLIIENRTKAGWLEARSCAGKVFPELGKRRRRNKVAAVTCLLAVAIFFVLEFEHVNIPRPWEKKEGPISQTIRRQIRGRPQAIRRALPKVMPRDAKYPPAPLEKAKALIENPSKNGPKQISVQQKAVPKILGTIAVNEHDWLADMIRKVYGVYTHEYQRLVVDANTQIGNPNQLSPGQVIAFPAVPVKVSPSLRYWWVEITRKKGLEEAYLFLRDHLSGALPMKMVPCWNNSQGLKFIILYGKRFSDIKLAQERLKMLPSGLAPDAMVLSDWGENTIFFARLQISPPRR